MRNEIEIPEEVTVQLSGTTLKVKGPKGESSRSFPNPLAKISTEKDNVIVESSGSSRANKRMVGTCTAHIKNMLKGVKEGFTYEIKISQTHFPIRTRVQGDQFIIENFLGERQQRFAKILPGVEVKIDGDIITVSSIEKEAAGQTAANIELAGKIQRKDRRVFKDGLFLARKGE